MEYVKYNSVSDPNFHRFRLPRIWSNEELRVFAHLFNGDVVNVSGWKDEDKEGKHYVDYFSNANSYSITNYKSNARGFQGQPNEVFLDLTGGLPEVLNSKFDVVFNHTTLEHIFEVDKAFGNLCKMTKDIVIVVVPFLQEMHGLYGDYWRFTPQVVKALFNKNGLIPLYLTFNTDEHASVYIFAIGSKNPGNWKGKIENRILGGIGPDKKNELIGYNALPTQQDRPRTSLSKRIINKFKRFFL